MAARSQDHHQFGGGWTALKLDVVGKYLRSFCAALKNQRFRRIYIDAFAGTGRINSKDGCDQPGSAKIALSQGDFNAYAFIERNTRHVRALGNLAKEYPEKQQIIDIRRGDANSELRALLAKYDARNWRGVIFLDPYGMAVEWETLNLIAQTRALDVWYLFPLSAVARQAANDFAKVDDRKAASLDRCLGTLEWRDRFYPLTQFDLFGTETKRRAASVEEIETFVSERLHTVFPLVAPPLRLKYSLKTDLKF